MSFNKWTQHERLLYAAGFIDGDGCMGTRRNGRGFNLQVQSAQSIRGVEIINMLHTYFDARTSTPRHLPRRKPMVLCWWQGTRAACFLEQIRPYLIAKKPQADLALEFHAFISTPDFSWTEANRAIGEDFMTRFQNFNYKGPLRENDFQGITQ